MKKDKTLFKDAARDPNDHKTMERVKKTGELYRITYLPANLEYYGAVTAINCQQRLKQHLSGKGGKHIYNLVQGEADENDFSLELLMIGEWWFCCEMEQKMKMHYNTLYPNGMNGELGRNIIRTEEGQRKVSEAVSRAKKGRSKETSAGVYAQSVKLSNQVGENRTEKQKAWDLALSSYSKNINRHPPTLIIGSRRINNGEISKFISPDEIDYYLSLGWEFGAIRPNKPLSEETRQKMRKPKSEETKKKMRESWYNRNAK